VLAIEAYTPQKGVREWYDETVARPWMQLVNGLAARTREVVALAVPPQAGHGPGGHKAGAIRLRPSPGVG
jgi:hypothetical protein